jgi:hypothetical protein
MTEAVSDARSPEKVRQLLRDSPDAKKDQILSLELAQHLRELGGSQCTYNPSP